MAVDPVRERRARVDRVAVAAKRVGYLLLASAIVVFLAGLATTFSETVSFIVVACLLTGSVILAPAIIVAYATRSAERQDRERGL